MANIIQPARKNIAIIDEFQTKTIDLNGDNIPDISHGHLVEAYLKASNPNVNTVPFPVSYQDNSKSNLLNRNDVFSALNKVSTRIQNGEKFHAVNFSISQSHDIDALSKKVNPNITKDNLTQYKPQIKDFVSKNHSDLNKEISAMEKITGSGVPVYIAAGNEKSSSYNLYGLAKGTKSIGATDYTGNIAGYSANNKDISQFEKGTYIPRVIKDSKGKDSGVDINNDGKPDLSTNILSGQNNKKDTSFGSGSIKDISFVSGTSFSTPVALAKDLNSSSSKSSSKSSISGSEVSSKSTNNSSSLKAFGPK